MLHRSRAIFLFLTIVSVLLVSAVGTTSVYADDGTPPPPPVEATEVDPSSSEGEVEPVATEPPVVEEPVATEPPVVEEPVATEPPVVDPAATEPPVATEPAVVEPVATEPPVTEPVEEPAPTEEAPVVEEQPPAETEPETLLEQVPDDTTVTVLNEEGEVLPLTTQESAEAIIEGDPIWCPASVVTPTPGANGCTGSMADFTELLNFLKENEDDLAYQQAGTIFVETGVYAGTEPIVDFNSYAFQYINNYDLTVTGGWDTVTGTTTGSTELGVALVIGSSTNPWIGSLTINNFTFTGVSDETALTLVSQDDISVNNVQVSLSLAGADLTAGDRVSVRDSNFSNNKQFGAKIDAGGDVQVVDSVFSANTSKYVDGYGLQVDSQGEVTLAQVTANNNEAFGADVQATGSVSIFGSFFNGNVSYSNTCWNQTKTGGYGLKVVAEGYVYLDEGVEANENYLYGAHLEAGADGAYVYYSSFNNNGSGSMNNPKGYGLEIISDGLVDINNVNANENQLFGANIQSGDEVFIVSSFFDGNKSYKYSCDGTSYYGYGLQVVANDDISLAFVSASENNLFGAHLEGMDVIILGELVDGVSNSTFSNNGTGNKTLTGKGLEIVSQGSVVLDTIQASYNQLFGADVQAVGDVTIVDSFFDGQKYTYSSSCSGSVTTGGYGLQVVTDGLITLNGVQANDNYKFGAKLVGNDAEDGVAISNSTFSNNKSGLEVDATGPVSLLNVTASGNKLFGADIATSGNVAISHSFFNGNQSYTSSSCQGKTYYGYGLKVVTTGGISVLDVTAQDNYVFGAYLEGTDITVVDSTFNSNGTDQKSDHVGKGLEIKSTGADSLVSLSGVTASNNQLFGAKVTAEGLVLVSNSTFIGNQSYTYSSCQGKTYDGYGIQVVTTGDVELNGVTAEQNYLFGAHLEGANVDVLNSVFSFNASPIQSGKTPTGRGLEVISTGTTLLQNVTASNNQLFGANVQAGGQVQVLNSVFADNKYTYSSSCSGTKTAGYGLKVVSLTTDPAVTGIILTSVQATGNGAEGAILDGQSTVNVLGGSFSNNGATGLSITAKGNVTLDNITASGNKGNGVYVKGNACANTVQVKGGTFTDNSKYGIKVVDAVYATDGLQTFANNGSGNVFTSGCVTSPASGDSQESSTSSGSSGYSGYWWYWWGSQWHWHH